MIRDAELAKNPRAVRGASITAQWFMRLRHSVRRVTPCTLPHTGPAILVANHTCGLDPAIIQSTCPRYIVWMMAADMIVPGLGWLPEYLDVIPVQRTKRDGLSIRLAMAALEAGRVVGIFAEGRIASHRRLLPFEPGVALLAKRSGAGVWPASIDGPHLRNQDIPESWLSRQHARVAYGPQVSTTGDLARDTDVIESRVADLLDIPRETKNH